MNLDIVEIARRAQFRGHNGLVEPVDEVGAGHFSVRVVEKLRTDKRASAGLESDYEAARIQRLEERLSYGTEGVGSRQTHERTDGNAVRFIAVQIEVPADSKQGV